MILDFGFVKKIRPQSRSIMFDRPGGVFFFCMVYFKASPISMTAMTIDCASRRYND